MGRLHNQCLGVDNFELLLTLLQTDADVVCVHLRHVNGTLDLEVRHLELEDGYLFLISDDGHCLLLHCRLFLFVLFGNIPHRPLRKPSTFLARGIFSHLVLVFLADAVEGSAVALHGLRPVVEVVVVGEFLARPNIL